MLVHSHGKPVRTPVSGNGCISEPFELLPTESGVKAGVGPPLLQLYMWNEMAVVKALKQACAHLWYSVLAAERGTHFSSQKLFHILFSKSHFYS